jgi:hypothetical protein
VKNAFLAFRFCVVVRFNEKAFVFPTGLVLFFVFWSAVGVRCAMMARANRHIVWANKIPDGVEEKTRSSHHQNAQAARLGKV